MTQIFSTLTGQIATAITRRADDAGNIPRSSAYDLQRQVGDLVTGFFIGWGGNGQRMPFDATPNGIVIPLSPYTVALWAGIKEAARLPVEQNAGLMRARLPADLFAQLQAARVDPFAVARGLAVTEQAFRPNPMATYEAPHTWVDPNGYRLSDRIWNTAGATRRKLDLFMESQIAAGRGAAAIAKDLEVFLQPGRQLLRTNAPYGSDASYDAMRLARTEIARAHAGAAEQSSLMNPFVTGLAVRLSGSHPKKDICDDAAADGPWPKDDIPHKFRVPLHPHCVTPGQLVQTEQGCIPIEQVAAYDNVLTHMGRYKAVKAAWSTPHDGLVYEFETERGCFELTGNHPVLLRRGWVEAQAVQIGDQVLYATSGVACDFDLAKMEHMPAVGAQKSVTGSVVLDFDFVPASTVAFNAYHYGGQSNVDEVASELVFPLIDDSGVIKRRVDGDFQGAGIGEPVLLGTFQHGHEAGIAAQLGERNFLSDGRVLGRIVLSSQIALAIDSAKCLTGHLATGAVILLPTGGDRVAYAAYRDFAQVQESAQNAKGHAILLENLRTGQSLNDIDVVQKGCDRPVVLCFETQDVKFEAGQVVSGEVAMRGGLEPLSTDGASNHDNLLSLSPDSRWGAESGNSVVSGVITPALALTDYSTIRAIRQRHYVGPVYNMEVLGDNSYTVGGAAVHNCLCTYRYIMAPADQQQKLIDEVRTVVVDARHKFADLVGPAAVEEFTNLLLRGGLNIERLTPGVGVPIPRSPVVIPTPAALVRTITRPAPAQPPTAPVAPAAAPAEPAQPLVSAGMQGPAKGQWATVNNRVAEAIDGIHKDGDLAPVPVKFAKMSSRHGHYKSQGRAPIEIKISTQSPHPHQTLAHEVGHWIDGQKVGISRAAQQYRPEEMPERFKGFFDAVRGSEAFNVLTELRMGKRKLEYINAGKVMQLPADYKYLTYVLRAEEIWARAYAQYVAVRSRDPVLLAELAADQAGRAYPVQWSDADFEPIATAIDQILAFVGWR